MPTPLPAPRQAVVSAVTASYARLTEALPTLTVTELPPHTPSPPPTAGSAPRTSRGAPPLWTPSSPGTTSRFSGTTGSRAART